MTVQEMSFDHLRSSLLLRSSFHDLRLVRGPLGSRRGGHSLSQDSDESPSALGHLDSPQTNVRDNRKMYPRHMVNQVSFLVVLLLQ
jgi:hypothetical protein